MTSSYMLLNDLRVHYLHWNLGDSGWPVLLLHGLASNARIWEFVAPALVERGLAPLAPDLRGHGLTDQPDGEYGFDTYQRDLAAFITANDLQKPLLVGHSWGAMLALDYAARFSAGPLAPAGIVLVDGGMVQLDEGHVVETQDFASLQARDLLTPPRWAGTSLDAFLEHLNQYSPHWQPDDQAVQTILANFEISEEETISPRLHFDHHMQIVRAMWEFKTYERFDRLRCPVLMVPARPPEPLSSEDFASLQAKEKGISEVHQRIADLQVHWIPDSIHDIPLQRPAELAELIADFAQSIWKK